MYKVIFGFFMLFLTACATNKFLNFTEDDLASPHKFKGGKFTYEQDSSAEASLERGMIEAKEYCGARKVFITNTNSNSIKYNSYVSLPQKTTYQGSISDSSNSTLLNVNGTETANSLVPIERTLTSNYVSFVCLDSDINQQIYLLTYSANNRSVPKCVDYTSKAMIGDLRLKTIANKSDSINCVNKEGWFSHYDDSLQKEVAVFIGKKGLDSCRKLEKHLVDNDILSDKIEYAAKKYLTCSN